MDRSTIILWAIAVIALIISTIKDKERTFNAMKMARGMMKNMIGQIIAILLFIGLILTFIPPETIKDVMGGDSNLMIATVIAALVGSITLIPAFAAFPLVGSIVDMGANIMPAAAFLTTLTMVGLVTFPLEKQTFGTQFAFSRNIMSFIFALVIAVMMGALI